MDLTPTAEQEAFRAECRGWLQEHLPWEYGVGLPPLFDDLAEEVAFLRTWQAALADVDVPITRIGVDRSTAWGDEWARLCRLDRDGALLVRPDQHIAWRAESYTPTSARDLVGAIDDTLGR